MGIIDFTVMMYSMAADIEIHAAHTINMEQIFYAPYKVYCKLMM